MVKCDDMEYATTGHFNLEFTRHAVPLSECGQNLFRSISWKITIDLPEDSEGSCILATYTLHAPPWSADTCTTLGKLEINLKITWQNCKQLE